MAIDSFCPSFCLTRYPVRHLVFWRKSWAGFRQKVFHRSQRDRQITCMPRWVNIIATSLICETSFRRTFFSFTTSSILMNLLQREMSKWQINLSKNKIRSIHILFMWAPRSLSPSVYVAACLKQFTVTSTCETLPPCTHAPITLKIFRCRPACFRVLISFNSAAFSSLLASSS